MIVMITMTDNDSDEWLIIIVMITMTDDNSNEYDDW